MLHIDGSRGEGGGQVLRSALTLALLTGEPIRLTNIRARRPKPGLMAQHLQAVQAAAAVGQARLAGAHLRSQSLLFEPQGIHAGAWRFDIGTAGSTSLVLQTILFPLSFAATASSITISGGTHVPWSPCFHFLELHWLPYLRSLGLDVHLELDLAGFYPQGGGRMRATVSPATLRSPLRLTERGALKRIKGLSAVANLEMGIAERQKRQALSRLVDHRGAIEIATARLPARSRGTMLLLLAEFEHAQCCYYALGARGKPAERVADEAVDALEAFLATDGAIDQYLADQLIVPLAFAPGVSELRTAQVTQHLVTNAEVVRLFLPGSVEIQGDIGQPGLVRVGYVGEEQGGTK
jgi:RNA 3'-terminal phosphate cyclase (ATP)